MKILHIIPSLTSLYGGPVQAVTQLCEELKNQGINVAIATTNIGKDKIEVTSNSIPLYSFSRQFSSFLPSDFAFSYGLKTWLKQHIREFDLLHIHCLFTYPSSIAGYYAHKYGIPYIVRPAGMLNHFCLTKGASKKKLYILFFEKRNIKNAAAIHFTSEQELQEAGKLRLNKQCILAAPGLNLGKFNNLEPLKGLFREQYPQIEDKKIILFLSRLDPKKGLDLLILALKILSTKRKDFVFVLAGSGQKNYERWVRRTLVKAGLSEASILTGFLEGKMKFSLLADADIFVLPSYDENFGIAVVEAMACGLPVIISNRVNIHNLIERYQAGIVTGLNSQDIAKAIDKLLQDTQLRFEMGACGKRLVEENFDIEKVTRQIRGAYSHLINRYRATRHITRSGIEIL